MPSTQPSPPRRPRGGALAVVAVERDDPAAPAGSAALRELRSVPLVRRVVLTLVRAVSVGRVVVTAAPGLAVKVEGALHGVSPRGGTGVDVLAVGCHGPGAQVLAGIDWALARSATTSSPVPGVVVVHDPLYALAPPRLVDSVVTGLEQVPGPPGGGRWEAALPVRAVTDTLMWVDAEGDLSGPADREAFRVVDSPQAFRQALLHEALRLARPAALLARGTEVLPELVHARGARLLPVAAPRDTIRIATGDDLALAEATLHAGAGHASR